MLNMQMQHTTKIAKNHIYLFAGRIGTETIGAADLFSAKILRAFFIFCLEAALAAAFFTASIVSST